MADKHQDQQSSKGLKGFFARNFGPDEEGHGFIPRAAGESFISALTFRTKIGNRTPLPLVLFLVPAVGGAVMMAPDQDAIKASIQQAVQNDAAFAEVAQQAGGVLAAREGTNRHFYVAVKIGDEYRVYSGRQDDPNDATDHGTILRYVDDPIQALSLAAHLSQQFTEFAEDITRDPLAATVSSANAPRALTLDGVSMLHRDQTGALVRQADNVSVMRLSGDLSAEASAMANQWGAVATAIQDGGYPYVTATGQQVVAYPNATELDSMVKEGYIANIGAVFGIWLGLSVVAGATVASRQSRRRFDRSNRPR